MLTHNANRMLNGRRLTGLRCLELASGGQAVKPDDEDIETYASDAISDILTIVCGIAGTTSYGGTIPRDEDAWLKAKELLDHALRSWEGDAEDYYREPEPGEYGHEEPTD